MIVDKKEFFGFVKFALLVAAVLVIAMAFPSCATASGPTTVINPASGQVIDVPAGNRVMIVSPGGGYSRQTDTRLQQEIVRASVDHHAISSRERTEMAEIEADREENKFRFKSDVSREVSDTIQNFQRERSYRSRDRQRLFSEVAPYAAKEIRKWRR